MVVALMRLWLRSLWVVLVVFCACAGLAGQSVDAPVRNWHAGWITDPRIGLREPVVLHFRRTVELETAPGSYIVRVSADNRFLLYVNGRRVGDGPARGDVIHWRYEKFDIAPFLRAGENRITATVWNFGIYDAVAQMSDRTAFLLESEAGGKEGISTPEGWQVETEPGRGVVMRDKSGVQDYMAQGPGEELDAAKFDWQWNDEHVAGGNWTEAVAAMRESINSGTSRAHSAQVTGDNPWGLVPDFLPHMTYEETTAGSVVRGTPNSLPATISANQHLHILLDRKTLTTAYPEMIVSGGKGARVELTYSEALYDKDRHKGDRDEVGDRQALGLKDVFLPDGGEHRRFESLWWRTWRYLDLDITTGDQPLNIESLKAFFTAYPFEERARLTTPDATLGKIWEISWRTARLDAHETYMDTPYWEQLQYVGDTRIQALISYAVANDDRLAHQALLAFDASRIPEGLTRSRYPSNLPQTIPTFSLIYIGMMRDWWMYRPDAEVVRALLPGERGVLGWFAQYERPDGLLEQLPWWSFVDWVPSGEIPTYAANGESCMTTLQYLGALNDAAALEQGLGDPVLAGRDRDRAAHVREGIYSQCWSAERGLLADNPDRRIFSQQGNILGVLYDVIPKDRQAEVLGKVMAIVPGTKDADMLSASYYFRFYLARALEHAGMADKYLDSIDPWVKLLPQHFSTWPEEPGNTRSDSHAWSAHPIYDLLTLVAGVEPASAGFRTVRIAPHLGSLKELKASFPHPLGAIEVEYKMENGRLDAVITLPAGLSGELVFGGASRALQPGLNRLSVNAH